jgi:chromate transporter
MDWPLLWKIFLLFSRVAIFSWGGGPASLALMQRETTTALWMPPGGVEAQPWVTSSEFADAVALGNALPGPIAPQVSAFVGYKLAGTPGAISAAMGTVLPTTVLMLIVLAFFFKLKDHPILKAMTTALRPLVVGLLLWTAYDMAKSVFNVQKAGWVGGIGNNLDKLAITLVSVIVLSTTTINPVILVILAAVLGLIVYR